MDRYEAQHSFWASFGVHAYEQNSVPDADDVSFPYITYESAVSQFDDDVVLAASVWTRSTSWLTADMISESIESRLNNGGEVIGYTGGMIWITAGSPFAQRMGDPDDDQIKRTLLSVVIHFS